MLHASGISTLAWPKAYIILRSLKSIESFYLFQRALDQLVTSEQVCPCSPHSPEQAVLCPVLPPPKKHHIPPKSLCRLGFKGATFPANTIQKSSPNKSHCLQHLLNELYKAMRGTCVLTIPSQHMIKVCTAWSAIDFQHILMKTFTQIHTCMRACTQNPFILVQANQNPFVSDPGDL